jgi:cytoskeletal protein CcmA (bactofilin family)
MLETFRKRDNARAQGPVQAPVRQPLSTPQVRINETRNDAPKPESETARPAPAEPVAAAKPPEQPQSQPQPQPAANAASGGTARLIVGAEIKLKGAEINDCDTLIVEGQVDAAMTSRVIEVAKTGLFRGKVQVDFAEIRGRFEGELTAHKQLMIRASGRVCGHIRYGCILIEEGGELSGDVAVTEANAAPRSRPSGGSHDVAAEQSLAARDSALTAQLNRMNSGNATQR